MQLSINDIEGMLMDESKLITFYEFCEKHKDYTVSKLLHRLQSDKGYNIFSKSFILHKGKYHINEEEFFKAMERLDAEINNNVRRNPKNLRKNIKKYVNYFSHEKYS